MIDTGAESIFYIVLQLVLILGGLGVAAEVVFLILRRYFGLK